jgi:hypothetical protein
VSSDVYEWRRDGISGCDRVPGCVSLISGGLGGYKTILLGVANEGRDVFFATHEKLLGQDQDSAGDVYDARVDGGFAPPPPRPTECEGSACSTSASPPNDLTPASFTFTGMGNVLAPPVINAKQKPKGKTARPRPKRKTAKRRHKTHKSRGARAGRRTHKGKTARGAGNNYRKGIVGGVR